MSSPRDALRLRVLAFVAAVAGVSVAAVTALALLFAPIPSGSARLGSSRAPVEREAPLALRGAAVRAHVVARELRSPTASADRPSARASGRGADGGPLPALPAAPAEWGPTSARASAHPLEDARSEAPAARHECLRSAIVRSPREARAPPLG